VSHKPQPNKAAGAHRGRYGRLERKRAMNFVFIPTFLTFVALMTGLAATLPQA